MRHFEHKQVQMSLHLLKPSKLTPNKSKCAQVLAKMSQNMSK